MNRLYDGKDFGYIIDYRGVLQDLDEALDIYGTLAEFDQEGLDDLCTTLTDARAERNSCSAIRICGNIARDQEQARRRGI